MNKLLTIIFSVAVVIVASAVGYYFAWFLPQARQAENLTDNQVKCSQVQEKQLAEYKKNMQSGGNSDIVSGTNHYNQKLHKCIVEINDYSSKSGTALNGKEYSYASSIVDIMDGLENTGLASCDINTDTTDPLNQKRTATCFNSDSTTISEDVFNNLEKDYLNN